MLFDILLDSATVDTEVKVKNNSPDLFFRFRFRIDIHWTDDLSHSCPHRYFSPNFTFAFAFVILKVINSETILFRYFLGDACDLLLTYFPELKKKNRFLTYIS